MITPVISSRSHSSRSTVAASDSWNAAFIVFADWSGSSSVRTTIPSSSRVQRIVVLSDTLDHRRDAHPGADAQRREAVATTSPLEFVEQRADDHAAGRTERMAHRDRATVDVHLLELEVHLLGEPEHDGGERLIDLDQVEIFGGDPRL